MDKVIIGVIKEIEPVSLHDQMREAGMLNDGVPVTTFSRSPTWALGANYVSEEEYQRLKGVNESA